MLSNPEKDNMELEAENRVRQLIEEYERRAQGDRLDGTIRRGEGTQGSIGTQGAAVAGAAEAIVRPETGGIESKGASPATPPTV